MKSIRYTKPFKKQFQRRIMPNKKLSEQFEERLKLFCAGVRNWPAYDHALTGNMVGFRAFSVAGDVRVIYVEEAEVLRFLAVGTHSQVYH